MSDTEETTDNSSEERILELKKEKRYRKTTTTKAKHALERLCADNNTGIDEIKVKIDTLWELLDQTLAVFDELNSVYIKTKEDGRYDAIMKESESFEKDIQNVIEQSESFLNSLIAKNHRTTEESNINIRTQQSPNSPPAPPPLSPSNSSHKSYSQSTLNARLQRLQIPEFDGDKTRFEDFWGLFISLVDSSDEQANVKMARLRQCLKGKALDTIRGLGVSVEEYEEAKEMLQSKFGGHRRQLQAYMDQLESMPPLKGHDVDGFERFADLVRITVVKMKTDGRDGELGEGTLHSILVRKLTTSQVGSYSRWLLEHKLDKSVLNLREWLKEEVKIRVEAAEMSHGVGAVKISSDVGGYRSRYVEKSRSRSFYSGVEDRSVKGIVDGVGEFKQRPPCVCCGGNHGVWSCWKFEDADVKERWNVAKEKRLCFRCLGTDHQGRSCSKARACDINGCKKNHHRLLHDSEDRSAVGGGPPVLPREGVSTRTRTYNTTTTPAPHSKETISLRTVPVWVKANGNKVKINALLDDGSNESFISEEVAGLLGIQEQYQTVKVHVLNDEVSTFHSMPTSVTIESINGQFCKKIDVKTSPHRIAGSYQVEDWSKSKEKWPHLRNCDFAEPAKDCLVDLLIGIDQSELHYSMSDVRGPTGGPIARLGVLGWSCIGSPEGRIISGSRTHVGRTFLAVDNSDSNSDIDQTLRRFWEIEKCGTEGEQVKVFTEEEKTALNKVNESLSYSLDTCRYKLSVPWKDTRPNLPDNYSMAKYRLSSTERKLNKNDFVRAEYQATLQSYIEKGYLRKVPADEEKPDEVWYLPHFPIVRPDKDTTKVRIVFDCSAKSDGVSLNDAIHAGPKLQQELFDVLLRFRRNPVAVVCDIKEMYLQVEIADDDRPFFRILWRDMQENREPGVYEFSRVVFGKNSAPMEAQFVAQENARRHKDTYPLAAEAVLKSTYMDDSLDSVETPEEGIELYRQLDSLWGLAGMKARKWISNSPEVVQATPKEDRATELKLTEANQEPVVKTLGVSWNSTEDTFVIGTTTTPQDTKWTKRSVLKKVATVFDPLGFVTPFVMVAKMLLQELWSRGYDWDDVIQDALAVRIDHWFDQLKCLSDVKVPRCLRESKVIVSKEIIVFVDASVLAYGTVAYLRCQYEDLSVSSRLIAARSKVAPLKPITVPRLELMGAILGVRLAQRLVSVFETSMQMVSFYSDSMDVLWWVRGKGRDFRPFVANRIGEIQLATEPSQWQYVPTDQNPADLCTRGGTPEELAACPLWWNGPTWLMEEKSKWPKMEMVTSPPKELKEMKVLLTTTPVKEVRKIAEWRLDPKRFSNWTRLVRLQARVMRVIYNMKYPKDRVTGKELNPEEITDAEEDVLRLAQCEAFNPEYVALASGKSLPRGSPLAKLNPRLDSQGIIRCDGRLTFAEHLPYDVRFPIILPRKHWVTKLIVKHYHEKANHSAGTNFILSQLSSRFWIIAAREEIRDCEAECNGCKKRKNKLASQIMAPLPQVRLRLSYRAFDQVGVDYAGPFTTVQGRGKQRLKRYLCLFTCLATRAVHLEVAWGLDTSSFLNALTRFTARRGVPKEIVSDNGTNFVGAVNELKELFSKFDKNGIQRAATDKGIKWKFNPPGAPHFGGVFEAMIKSAKKAIYAEIGNSSVTDEELITICSGAESLLNSRPITYQSSDPRDDVPLTPNHFLHGQMGGLFAPEVPNEVVNPHERWRKVQSLITRVWQRWLKEYLPTLNARPKWSDVVKDLKEGDVVLVLDKDIPRGRWPLGRITECFPSKDGHTRVVKSNVDKRLFCDPFIN